MPASDIGAPSSVGQQLSQQAAFGVYPRLVVSTTVERGRSVHYVDQSPLLVGSLAALYRCLLVRHDRFESWRASGEVTEEANTFFRNYSVALRFDDSDHEWLCLPAGDDPADGSKSWWRLGALSKKAIRRARSALNQRILCDWRRHADPQLVSDMRLPSGRLRMLGPLFNEPEGNAPPNVDVRAHGAYHCGSHFACGIMMVTEVVREIRQGDELVWCYGPQFHRHYNVSMACTSHGQPTLSESASVASRIERAAAVLTRGQERVERHDFKEACTELGWEMRGEDSSEMLDQLFVSWDRDESNALERREIMAGLEQWHAEGMGTE